MRKLLTILSFVMCLGLFAQDASIDPRLHERFSDTQIANMDESRLAYWTYYLDHSFQIMDVPQEKAAHLADLEVLEGASSAGFHGFTMILDRYQKDGAFLRFANEDKLISIKPMSQFIAEFNTYYQSKK